MLESYYILTNGKLSVKDKTLSFENKYKKITSIPIKQLKDLYLSININPTPDVLKLIMDEGINVHYFNFYGFYLGSLISKNHKNSGKLIIKEVEVYKDETKRLEMAKEIISSAFKNINNLVSYYGRRKNIINKLNLEYFLERINNCVTINQIMLVEAEYRKIYYSHISEILEIENFNRVFQEAKDLVNILFNFINSLLYSVIFSEIMKTNVSGQIGFIHEVNNNRYPLVYDVSEIFKPILVDRLIFRLINRKQLDNSCVDENGRLSEEAVKIVFKEWDELIGSAIYSESLKRVISYKYLIREEIYKLERFFSGKKKYKGFVYWW